MNKLILKFICKNREARIVDIILKKKIRTVEEMNQR